MKIKVKNLSYDDVLKLPAYKHKKVAKQSFFFRKLMYTLSKSEVKKVNFTHTEISMDKLGAKEPALYLMNHSSFIDLSIASVLINPKPYHIICTSDGFVGKEILMRGLGCIPTRKFQTDVALVKDMQRALKNLKSSVLMYPEASYTFDGCATPLPEGLGKFIKLLKVPVVMIKTNGAFLRDPLYNCLQLRKVDVNATMEYILSPDDIESMKPSEINELLKKHFTFDNFKFQQVNHIKVDEPFRADGLNRILYKCPCCMTEGNMKGAGITLRCNNCGTSYRLDEYGYLCRENTNDTINIATDTALQDKDISKSDMPEGYDFSHIPDWYRWERDEVRREIENGTYKLEVPVKIRMMVNFDAVYEVGDGILTHTVSGFHLTGCDGKLEYFQKSRASYSLYSDYYWYELGDMICIGDTNALYYCFPPEDIDIVAKTRLATEEIYKCLSSAT